MKYLAQQGDCISSIAARFGLPWQLLWNHVDNAELRRLRKDPNVLFPGDIVVTPEKNEHHEECPTDDLHRFRKKGSPVHIRLRLLTEDEPRAFLSYELEVSGHSVSGTTDADGFLQEDIPANAAQGTLTVKGETGTEIYTLAFGTLDPIETQEGVRKRLECLGFAVEPDLEGAVGSFQSKMNLQSTGKSDDRVRSLLQAEFGQ